MSDFKSLHGVQLQHCCTRTIDRIRHRTNLSKALRIGAPACIFVQMFLGPPKSQISKLYSVSSTDWGLLAEMVKGVDAATNRRNAEDAFIEATEHSGQLGGFWMGIYNRFSGY